jgi:hypothetical protein
VADLTREELQRLARLGARARLDELQREEAAIRRAFPDLFGRGRGTGNRVGQAGGRTVGENDDANAPRRRKRSSMSAAARKAVSERMKKYWAGRRKDNK